MYVIYIISVDLICRMPSPWYQISPIETLVEYCMVSFVEPTHRGIQSEITLWGKPTYWVDVENHGRPMVSRFQNDLQLVGTSVHPQNHQALS